MSLKSKVPYLRKSIKPTLPGTTKLVLHEGGEDDTDIIVPTKELYEGDPIDLWTHEFSETTVLNVLDREKLPRGSGVLSRYTIKDGETRLHHLGIPHIAVSHHTKSGLDEENVAPEQFEEFLWKSGKLSNIYPKMQDYYDRWKATGEILVRAKTKADLQVAMQEGEKIKEESVGKVPLDYTDYMSRKLQGLKKKIESMDGDVINESKKSA